MNMYLSVEDSLLIAEEQIIQLDTDALNTHNISTILAQFLQLYNKLVNNLSHNKELINYLNVSSDTELEKHEDYIAGTQYSTDVNNIETEIH